MGILSADPCAEFVLLLKPLHPKTVLAQPGPQLALKGHALWEQWKSWAWRAELSARWVLIRCSVAEGGAGVELGSMWMQRNCACNFDGRRRNAQLANFCLDVCVRCEESGRS